MRSYTLVDWATQSYLLLVALLVLLFYNQTVPAWPGLVGVHLALMLLIHTLVRTERARPGAALLDFLRQFYPVLLYAGLFREIGWINRMFVAQYLDPMILGWEQALFGCQPSLEWMAKAPVLAISELFYASYFSYYVMIGGVGLALFFRNRQHFAHYLSVVSFVFYVCFMLYLFLPVIGPRLFFHPFDSFVLSEPMRQMAARYPYPESIQRGPFFEIMKWIYRGFDVPGAALPSSHVAVALCTVSFSFRYLRPVRHLHLVVAVLLCFSTIYCRYHYALDVIAGALTASVLVPLGNRLYFRLRGVTAQSPALARSALGNEREADYFESR